MSAGGGIRQRAGLGRIVSGVALLAMVLAPAGALGSPPAKRAGDAGPAETAAKPRELSAVERAAVELAVAYLQRGPEAWWDRLAAGSPLRRLGHDAALDEIAARVGPADGSTWQLLTPGRPDAERAVFGIDLASGLDDTLTLRLVDEGGWKIAELRTAIDPVDVGAVIPSLASRRVPSTRLAANPAAPAPIPAAAAHTASAPERPASSASSVPGPFAAYLPLVALGVAALALLLGAAGALVLGKSGHNAAALGVGAASAVIVAGALFWGWSLGGRRPAPVHAGPVHAPGRGGLGTLVALRNALASGTDRAEIERLLAVAPRDPKLHDVQELWRAQYLLGEGNLAGADAALRGFPEDAPYPLAELLRARLAFRRMKRDETGWLYEKALSRGLDNDGLRLESGFAKVVTDDADRAEIDFTQMVEMGSRLAEPWYVAAQIAASQDRIAEAETFLHLAWQLEPAPRADLFANPALAFLVARPSLFPLFKLGVAEEALIAPTGARQPLTLPAGASAATCGQSLRLALAGSGPAAGGAELLVPGGAGLAPADAVLEDADTWSRHAEAKALAALPAVKAKAASGGGLQPRLLRVAERAGRALAQQNRWNEVVGLTDPVASGVESAPASLVRLRAQALHHLARDEEARQLLVRLAKTDIAGRRPAAGTLFDLAELFAAADQFDIAIKLLEKADSQLPAPRGQRRRRQLAMDRELATSYASFRSEHFEVRYPKATGERYGRQVAWVLEEERQRLQHWIPPAAGKRIEVHLFPLKDFYSSFGGDIAVVGIFDGKVRVPFAELRSLHPQLVAILSHELAHALIADATHSQAPHWLQEGLAQHIEMGTRRVNPLPDLARTGRALSFPTVDPILRGFAEEQLVELAYSEAAWAVDFIETRFGDKAIPRLLGAFAAGKTTDQALRDVCGMAPAEFDRALWAWGTGQGPQVRSLEARRYDQEYAVMERREHEAESPHAGLRADDLARRQSLADERKQRMAGWYAAYSARTMGIKRALKPILQAYEGERGAMRGGTAAACGDLSADVERALADHELWTSLDGDVNRSLRDAYRLIGNLGDACRTGRDAQARALIDQVSAALGKAAQRLAPYGLTP